MSNDAADPSIDASGTTASAPSNCPRCDGDISAQEYYGICSSCTTELRERFDGSTRGDVEAAEYEPKMNVTPNAVALKE